MIENCKSNICAMSAEFHTHPQYQEFYDRFGARLNGFTGIYDYVILLADKLTLWERKNGGGKCWEDSPLDWMDTVQFMVSESIRLSFQYGTAAAADVEDIMEKQKMGCLQLRLYCVCGIRKERKR